MIFIFMLLDARTEDIADDSGEATESDVESVVSDDMPIECPVQLGG